MDPTTDIKAKCVEVSSFIRPSSAIDIRSNIHAINDDILANLESDVPVTGCLTNYNKCFSLLGRSTTNRNSWSKLTSNSAKHIDSSSVIVCIEISHSCHNKNVEYLKINDAFKWKVVLSDDTFNEAIGKLYNIIHSNFSN